MGGVRRKLALTSVAVALGVGAVAVAQGMAQQDVLQARAGSWTIFDGPQPNGERQVVAERIPGEGSEYRYEALAGGERLIRRGGCGSAERTIWLTGSRVENLAAARVAIQAVAGALGDCDADASGDALRDFDAAFAALEDRVAARPFDEIMAWRFEGDDMMGSVRVRTEGPLRVEYRMAGQAQPTRIVLIAQACQGRPRSFQRQFANAEGRVAQVAAANAALGAVLAEAQRTCGLDAAVPARLSRGFAEAVAADFFDPATMTDTNSSCDPQNCNAM